MYEKLEIIEKLRNVVDIEDHEGYCVIKDEEIVSANDIFFQHLTVDKKNKISFSDLFSDMVKEKIKKINSTADFEDVFFDPVSLILLTLTKFIDDDTNEYLIIITNDSLHREIIKDNLNVETFYFEKDEILKINDEKTFYDTMNILPDFVVVTDLIGTILFASSNFINLMPSQNKYVSLASSIFKFLPRNDRRRVIRLFVEYLLSKQVNKDNQIRIMTKNGKYIYLEVNVKPFKNNLEKIYLLHTLRDVSHRVELEQKLIESEKSFKSTILNSPLGVHLYLLDNNNDLIFVAHNEAADSILHIEHKDLLNLKIEDAFPGLINTEIPEIYKRIAVSGDKYFFEQVDYEDDKIRGAFEVHAYQTYENHMAAIFLDVSQRKRSEQELLRLEKEYRNIFDNAPYAIFQTTLDGRFLRINKQGAILLGYDTPEEIFQNINDIRVQIYYNPEDRNKLLEKLMLTDSFVREYLVFRKKSGEPFDTEMIARIVRDDSGNPVFLEGFIKDISRRKKAEAELRQIYSEQQTIFDSIPASICYKDTNGIYLRINKTGAKFLNRKVKNIIGKNTEEFYPKHIAEKFLKEDLKVINSGKPLIGIIDRLYDKDGNDLWIKTDRIPYLNEVGIITGVISISFDITQQYETEEKVRRYLEYLEFLNKTSLDLLKLKSLDEIYSYINKGVKVLFPESLSVVLAYDVETGTAQVKSMSKQLIDIFNIISQEFSTIPIDNRWRISERYLDSYKKAELTKIEDSFIEIASNNLSPEIAKKISDKINISDVFVIGICKDDVLYGIVFIFPQKKLLFDYSKNIEAFMYQCALAIDQKIAENKLLLLNYKLEDRVKERTKLLQDTLDDLSSEINVRKVIEKELINAKLELTKALEKEKELNELKSRFIDMISHEYRTPLTVILSSMYLIESYTESGDITKVRKHTEKVKKSVDIMTNLIEHVLTIGRGEAEKIIIEKRWFEVDRILRDVIDEVLMVDKEMHPINLTLKSEINQIYSDSRLLRQILTNIILNAVKYSEPQSPVEIEVFNDLENITITVSDQGLGMDQDEIEHVFDAFFRGKNQIGLTSGTGLGLTIVKRFTDLLEGKILIESKVNQGTKFKIILPSK